MMTAQQESLSVLYEQDETAWLEAMSELVAQGLAELDYQHLSEYLADMAKRDRREVFSRLVVLLNHLLKWQYQAERRTGSWRGTIREPRQLLESGTLRNHAQAVLLEAYQEARQQAADETESSLETFPTDCAWDLEELLRQE